MDSGINGIIVESEIREILPVESGNRGLWNIRNTGSRNREFHELFASAILVPLIKNRNLVNGTPNPWNAGSKALLDFIRWSLSRPIIVCFLSLKTDFLPRANGLFHMIFASSLVHSCSARSYFCIFFGGGRTGKVAR